MQVMLLDQHDDFEVLRPLFDKWYKESAPAAWSLGVELSVQVALLTAKALATNHLSDFLVLLDDGNALGCMGIRYLPHHVGPDLHAHECLFFTDPSSRGAGIRLVNAVRKLASSRNCRRLYLTASKLASTTFDRTCAFYEKLGLKNIEATYFEEL